LKNTKKLRGMVATSTLSTPPRRVKATIKASRDI
jgi:hypothetical protein